MDCCSRRTIDAVSEWAWLVGTMSPDRPLAISWFVVVVIVAIVVFACTFVIVTDIVNIFIYPVTIFDNHLGAASPIV